MALPNIQRVFLGLAGLQKRGRGGSPGLPLIAEDDKKPLADMLTHLDWRRLDSIRAIVFAAHLRVGRTCVVKE